MSADKGGSGVTPVKKPASSKNGKNIDTAKMSTAKIIYTSENGGSLNAQYSEKRGPGRPLSSNDAYIKAIKAAYPPGTLTGMMREAYDMAVKTNSWRGMVAVAEFAANYSLGKPVKRVESTGDSSLADLLAGVDTSKPLMAGPAKDSDDTDASDE